MPIFEDMVRDQKSKKLELLEKNPIMPDSIRSQFSHPVAERMHALGALMDACMSTLSRLSIC